MLHVTFAGVAVVELCEQKTPNDGHTKPVQDSSPKQSFHFLVFSSPYHFNNGTFCLSSIKRPFLIFVAFFHGFICGIWDTYYTTLTVQGDIVGQFSKCQSPNVALFVKTLFHCCSFSSPHISPMTHLVTP